MRTHSKPHHVFANLDCLPRGNWGQPSDVQRNGLRARQSDLRRTDLNRSAGPALCLAALVGTQRISSEDADRRPGAVAM